jgi:hypothetical protein
MMRAVLLAVIVGAASLFVVAFRMGEGQPGTVAVDVYGYFYPNMLHALAALRDGGGLLWNPFQNCGQPFLGISETGLYYPLNAFFLVLPPQRALRALLLVNLIIGGLGAYALGRELGMSAVAAVGTALAFILGNAAYHVTTWMPTVQAPYIWMPFGMLFCERLLKGPTVRDALLLGLVLAAGLLPGHPQFVGFTCQLIALRVLWAVLDRCERRHIAGAAGAVALAVLVMLLVAAMQFVPSLEVIGESVRRHPLDVLELAPAGVQTPADIARLIKNHHALAPFNVVPGFLAVLAIARGRGWRVPLFYFIAGAVFLFLSLGVTTRISDVYFKLPFSSVFREPARLRFITGFCFAVLAGFAIDTLSQGSRLALAIAAATLAALALWVGRVLPIEWALGGIVLGAALLAAAAPRLRTLSAATMVAAIALTAVVTPIYTIQRYLTDDAPLRVHAGVFERLRARLTPQDRAYFALPAWFNGAFQEKSAMYFRIRSVTDYELELTRRYAEYSAMLRRSAPLRSVNEVYFPGVWRAKTVSWPLVHLAAGRYLVADRTYDKDLAALPTGLLSPVDGDEQLAVFELPGALPRAYYVPQVRIVDDGEAELRELAAAQVDPRHVALVDTATASAFTDRGNDSRRRALRGRRPRACRAGNRRARARFRVPRRSVFSGWSAQVNGQDTPIMLADHTFFVWWRCRRARCGSISLPAAPGVTGILISALALLIVVARLDLSPTSAGCRRYGTPKRTWIALSVFCSMERRPLIIVGSARRAPPLRSPCTGAIRGWRRTC